MRYDKIIREIKWHYMIYYMCYSCYASCIVHIIHIRQMICGMRCMGCMVPPFCATRWTTPTFTAHIKCHHTPGRMQFDALTLRRSLHGKKGDVKNSTGEPSRLNPLPLGTSCARRRSTGSTAGDSHRRLEQVVPSVEALGEARTAFTALAPSGCARHPSGADRGEPCRQCRRSGRRRSRSAALLHD